MLFVFGFALDWFPSGGSVDSKVDEGTFAYVVSKINHLILPALSTALIATTSTIQYLRNEIIDNKIKDFVRTARSKGVPESNVYSRHILRNSFLPIAAFLGYEITGLIGGAVMQLRAKTADAQDGEGDLAGLGITFPHSLTNATEPNIAFRDPLRR